MNDTHDNKIKETINEYDRDRVLNLRPGDLVRNIGNSWNKLKDERGFIIKKSQARRPHRSDVYLVKLQGKEPKEIDERWIMKLEEEDG